MAREIEVKITHADFAYEELIVAISSRHELNFATQVDEIFAATQIDVLNPTAGTVICRTRTVGDEAPVLTVKRRRSHNLDRDEEEVKVESVQAIARVLALMGFGHVAQISKRRAWTRLTDELTICIDSVVELGVFVEIEALIQSTSSGGYSASEIEQTLRLVDPRLANLIYRPGYSIVEKGYDTLLLEMKNS